MRTAIMWKWFMVIKVKSNLGLEVDRVAVYMYHDIEKGVKYPVRYGWKLLAESSNIITLKGTDAFLKLFANPSATFISGAGWIEKIAVGDGEDIPNENDETLKGVSTLEKTINLGDYTYVRPILIMSVLYGKNEANFNWNEGGLKDNNGDLVARVLLNVPLFQPKLDAYAGLMEWQIRR